MIENLKAKKNRVKNGFCYRCCEPAFGKTLCPKCCDKQKKKDRKKRKFRKENNLCLMCGGETNATKTCDNCLTKKRTKENTRKENGLCSKCGKHKSSCGILCEICYFKSVSNRHFKSCARWEELKNLLHEQKYKCPYSGHLLEAGKNISLDHIVPKHKGGTDDKSNIQWVFAPLNTMKLDMLESEFLFLIEQIHRYVGEKCTKII